MSKNLFECGDSPDKPALLNVKKPVGHCRSMDIPKHRKSLEVESFCPICRAPGRFSTDSPWLRDFFRDATCDSIPRERELMAAIDMLYPQWRGLTIHESSPSERGASLLLKRQCPNYTASFYYPAIPLG